jgi:putative flippase GtrA
VSSPAGIRGHLRRFSSRLHQDRRARYLLVGALAWLVDFAVFAVLHRSSGVVVSQTAARLAGAAFAFAGHKYFVFGDFGRSYLRVGWQAVAYGLLWLVSYALSTGGILVLVSVTHADPLVAKFIVETVLVMFNFLVAKRLVFR